MTNTVMSSAEELQAALDRLSKGIRDPESARKSRERMDQMREANRASFGTQNIAGELIRESRESRWNT
jgi:hypothetical protein